MVLVTAESLRAQVDRDFEWSTPGGPRLLRLQQVEVPPGSGQDGYERFAALFVDPAGAVQDFLPQGTYELRNETLGCLHLFLVPVGPAPGSTAMRYEAVFSYPVADNGV